MWCVILCYVMLCYVMLCYVMLCYAIAYLGDQRDTSIWKRERRSNRRLRGASHHAASSHLLCRDVLSFENITKHKIKNQKILKLNMFWLVMWCLAATAFTLSFSSQLIGMGWLSLMSSIGCIARSSHALGKLFSPKRKEKSRYYGLLNPQPSTTHY